VQLVGAEEQQDGEEIDQETHGRDYGASAVEQPATGTLMFEGLRR
jgi:hypothetical protein